MLVRVLLICLSAIVPHITCSIQPTEDFPHIAEMDPDGKYLLYWSFTDSDITFEVRMNIFDSLNVLNCFYFQVILCFINSKLDYFHLFKLSLLRATEDYLPPKSDA